uniref:Uncharacterized protein n=1 Tax=Plectus sambesii TaxID=2011161 RepID=A0A914XQN9_9BILA
MPGIKVETDNTVERSNETMQTTQPISFACCMSHFKPMEYDQFIWLCEQRKLAEARSAEHVQAEESLAAREQLRSMEDSFDVNKYSEKMDKF